MTTTEARVGTVPFHINGAWEKRRERAIHPVTNPATGAIDRRSTVSKSGLATGGRHRNRRRECGSRESQCSSD